MIFSDQIFSSEHKPTNCSKNSDLYRMRSKELKQLVNADQLARKKTGEWTQEEMWKIYNEDLARRKRVGEIFGEGCFRTGKDYLAAALIYQHGNTPDHYYQAYIWAAKANELGEKGAKRMIALAVDRYLINIGKKPLFGTQYHRDFGSNRSKCFCLHQPETTFPDSVRKEYLGKSLYKEYSRIQLERFNNGKDCLLKECSEKLTPTPKGTIPGLW